MILSISKKKTNSKVKKTHKLPFNTTLGYSGNPEIIFNRILSCIKRNDKIDILLKINDDKGDVIWTKNTFYANNDRTGLNYDIDVKVYHNQEVIAKVDKLYNTLLKIEKRVSPFYADKYLDGYLEAENITLCKIISHYMIA